MIELTFAVFRCGPYTPPVCGIDDGGVRCAAKFSLNLSVALKLIEIFEEEDPARLFGLIQLGGAASLFA